MLHPYATCSVAHSRLVLRKLRSATMVLPPHLSGCARRGSRGLYSARLGAWAAIQPGAAVCLCSNGCRGWGWAALRVVLVHCDALLRGVAACLGLHRRAASARALLSVLRAGGGTCLTAYTPFVAPWNARMVLVAARRSLHHVVTRALAQCVLCGTCGLLHALAVVLVHHLALRIAVTAWQGGCSVTGTLLAVLGTRLRRWRGWSRWEWSA